MGRKGRTLQGVRGREGNSRLLWSAVSEGDYIGTGVPQQYLWLWSEAFN